MPASSGVNTSSRCLSGTAEGQLGKARWAPWAMVRTEDTSTQHERPLTPRQLSLYSTVPSRRPFRDSPPPWASFMHWSSQLHFICKQDLGRQVYTWSSENSVSRLAAFLWRQITSIMVSFLTESVHDCCPAHTDSKLNYSSVLKCPTFCIKVPCFEEPVGVEKISLEMSQLYFRPSCSMW